jgi:hypothetical protein
MITLEGYEIEEMRSINHIMTVELQFDKPVTQAEAQNYLSRVLARANEMEAQNEKEICKKIFNADGIISKSALAAAFGVPESELNIDARETYPAADMDPINTTAKRTFEETANKSSEIADENPEIANDEAFDAEVRAEFQKAKKPKEEKSKPGPKRSKIDWDKACALKKAGWSNNEIATEVHAPVGTINSMIYQRMKEYNEGKRVNRCEEVETEEA